MHIANLQSHMAGPQLLLTTYPRGSMAILLGCCANASKAALICLVPLCAPIWTWP